MSSKREYKIGQRYFIARHGIVEITGTHTGTYAGIETAVYLTKKDKNFSISTKLERNVPLNQADRTFISLPNAEEFQKIIKVVHQKPRPSKLPSYRVTDKFEQKLASGDLISIAEVFRDTVSADTNRRERDEIPDAYRPFKEEAIATLLVCYREAFGVDTAAAMDAIFQSNTKAPKAEPPVNSIDLDLALDNRQPKAGSKKATTPAPALLPDTFKDVSSDETIMNMSLTQVFRPTTSHTRSPNNDPAAQVERMSRSNSRLKTLGDLWSEVTNPDWEKTAAKRYSLHKRNALALKSAVAEKVTAISDSFAKNLV